PGNQYGIPYLWGTTGIGVNEKLVKAALGDDAPVDSWDLVLDPKYASKLKDCGISFLDAYDEIFPAVLNYEGEDPTSQDVNLFKTKVEPVLEAVHPYIRYYNSSKYINDLANGDICAAVGWSGDVLQAAARAEEAHQPFKVSYSIPKEGTLIWIDMMAIPIDAPHPDNAHKFINFLMDPKVIAGVSNTVRYANGNKAADEFVDPDLLADKQVYPPADVRSKCYTLPPYPPKVDRQGLRMWTRIKTGR
ncbi:MAG: extracellular solute-binding protein, partial [Pseudomonadales bacterium]|nr:extracellular solute-binding protein [Pseudomonadales bacterium]